MATFLPSFISLLDLLFVALWSAILAITFDDYYTSNAQCTSWTPYGEWRGTTPFNPNDVPDTVCDLQLSLLVLNFFSVILYQGVLIISLFRSVSFSLGLFIVSSSAELLACGGDNNLQDIQEGVASLRVTRAVALALSLFLVHKGHYRTLSMIFARHVHRFTRRMSVHSYPSPLVHSEEHVMFFF